MKTTYTLQCVVNGPDGRYRKRLHSSQMAQTLDKIVPTQKQLNSTQWLRDNGWRKITLDNSFKLWHPRKQGE